MLAFVWRAAGPARHDSSCGLDDRDERLDIVGLQTRFDHQVNEARGDQAEGIAIAAANAAGQMFRNLGNQATQLLLVMTRG